MLKSLLAKMYAKMSPFVEDITEMKFGHQMMMVKLDTLCSRKNAPQVKAENNYVELVARMKANQDKLAVMYLEANPEEIEAVSGHQEVLIEVTAEKIIWSLNDRYGDRHLAIGHCCQPKKRILDDGKSRKKLTTPCCSCRA
jgi:hypothetical protein